MMDMGKAYTFNIIMCTDLTLLILVILEIQP
jgi:hypothetical protein